MKKPRLKWTGLLHLMRELKIPALNKQLPVSRSEPEALSRKLLG